MTEDRLSMQGMTKQYGVVTVLENVDFRVRPGEVHGLVGENGAGKSTLLKMLSGVISATRGKILLDGKEVQITDPLSARNLGIAMIHQELQNVPELTVFQNMFLGRPRRKHGVFVDKAREIEEVREVLKRLDPSIDPRSKIGDLKVSQQQIVEIARALLEKARVIAMDEPTSSLTPQEFERLAVLIRDLAAEGVSIIYVSHKMDELFKVCDRATILRDGHYIDCVDMQNETEDSIVTRMVGRKIEKVGHQSYASDECVLEVRELAREPVVKKASFKVHRGEVLGISGLVGAGRTELFRLIAGLDKPTSGEVLVKGQALKPYSVHDSIAHGIGLVPDMDRYTRMGMIRRGYLRGIAYDVMKGLNLHPLDVDRAIGTLSGGNQQKVIIGRWLASGTEIFLFDEPTRGIDVGAKSEIYGVIEELARQGKVVMVISSEMPEIIRISDRVLVMREGEIVAELTGSDINEGNLGAYAIGQGKKAL